MVSCFNSPDGMGQCLRGKMAEVGLVPAAAVPAVAETPDAPAAIGEEAVTPASEQDVAEASVDDVIAATFGLLRAEPDGSVVIAGSGTPGSKVQVFANGELLGAVEVEANGDWVFIPDQPLATGGLEITLGEEGKPGTAEDAFIVVINEDRTTQPLVVASTPGEASQVLQGLTPPAEVAAADVPAATQPAAAVPATETAPAPEAAETEPAQVAAVSETAVSSEPAPAATPAETPVEAPAESASPQAVTETETAEVTSAPETAPVAAESTPATTTAKPATTEPATAEPVVTSADTPVPADTIEPVAEPAEPAVAAAPDATTPASAPVALADVAPTIDAIEIETDKTFFAGAGPDGGIIRLYVDDAFVADTTVEGGRWLVEAGPVLDAPSQRVRADLLAAGSADVVARAEVDFVVSLPEAEPATAVAEAPTPQPTSTETVGTEAPAQPDPAPTADTAAPAAPAEVTIAEAAPAPETASQEAPTTEAQPTPAAAPATTPAATAEPVAAPATTQTEVAAAPPAAEAVPATPAVPTMVAVSLGDPDAQRFASGKAIIRRGDNLWTIARRVYGEGLKYTTIYEANTGQIRDPDRIYPGQVFDLPADQANQ